MPPPLTIDAVQETFEVLTEWEDRYQFIVELGAGLPALADRHRTHDNRVHGCMSKVWFTVTPDEQDRSRLVLHGDSDNAVVKGLAALLIALYSGHTASQIAAIDADQVFDRLGLYDHLSPTRHVGVYAMVEKIKTLSAAVASDSAGLGHTAPAVTPPGPVQHV